MLQDIPWNEGHACFVMDRRIGFARCAHGRSGQLGADSFAVLGLVLRPAFGCLILCDRLSEQLTGR